MKGSLKVRVKLPGIEKLIKGNNVFLQKAQEKAALQMLTWMNSGSPNTSAKPPIMWGVLRGSSSAFVNNVLVAVFESSGITGAITPAIKADNPKKNKTIWVWNTAYSAKMHYWTGGWGPVTIQDGDAGNQWVWLHLKNDAKSWYKLIVSFYWESIKQ